MARYRVLDGGVAGVALALRLRLRGHEVHVDPSAPAPSLDEDFTLPAPFRDLFLKSDGALDEAVPFHEASGRGFQIRGTALQFDPAGVQANIIAVHWGTAAGREWAAMLADAADVWSGLRAGQQHSTRTLRTVFREHLRDARLRELLDAYLHVHAAADPALGDAVIVLPYLDQTFGRWRFDGGIASLEAELARRCTERGVHFDGGDGEAISVRTFWDAGFMPPSRRWRRQATPPSIHRLGLPWIGMAAEYVARATPRAR